MIADNPVEELRRLEEAINSLRRLGAMKCCSSSELDLTGEGREVIEAYRLFAYDQGWRQRMRDAVRDRPDRGSVGGARAGRNPPARAAPG